MLDVDWLEELFSPFGAVRVSRLFGGQAVYLDGLTVALVMRGVLYLKTDPETAPAFEAAALEPFTYTARGRERAVMSFRKAPAEALDDADALAPWIALAREAAVRKASRGSKKPRAAGKGTSTAKRRRATAEAGDA